MEEATQQEASNSNWEELDALPLDKLALGPKPGQSNAIDAAPAGGSTAAAAPAAPAGAAPAVTEQTQQPAARALTTDEAYAESTHIPAEKFWALIDAMINPKNRQIVLRYEADVESFVRNSDQKEMKFPEINVNFQRMLAHTVAQYYKLQTSSINSGEHSGKILARRTRETRLPKCKLADLELPEGSSEASKYDAPRLLLKKQHSFERGSRSAVNGEAGRLPGSDFRKPKCRPHAERAEDYNRARARIYSNGELSRTTSITRSNSGVSSSGLPSVARNGSVGGNNAGYSGSGHVSAGVMVPSQQQALQPRSPSLGAGEEGGTSGGGNGGGNGNAAGKKAVLRNKEEDARDPDFKRGFHRYGPRFEPGYGEHPGHAQGLYARPTYGSEFPELPGGGPMAGLAYGQHQQQGQPDHPPSSVQMQQHVGQMMQPMALHHDGSFIHAGPGPYGNMMQYSMMPAPGHPQGVPHGMPPGMQMVAPPGMPHGGMGMYPPGTATAMYPSVHYMVQGPDGVPMQVWAAPPYMFNPMAHQGMPGHHGMPPHQPPQPPYQPQPARPGAGARRGGGGNYVRGGGGGRSAGGGYSSSMSSQAMQAPGGAGGKYQNQGASATNNRTSSAAPRTLPLAKPSQPKLAPAPSPAPPPTEQKNPQPEASPAAEPAAPRPAAKPAADDAARHAAAEPAAREPADDPAAAE